MIMHLSSIVISTLGFFFCSTLAYAFKNPKVEERQNQHLGI
jgi:hypothetical protein